jgi:guanylate kinase
VDGVDYHFVGEDEFQRRVDAGGSLEWAVVHGNRYGTGAEYRTEWIERGPDVLFDVDVQGAARLAAAFPGAAKLFLLPPSFAVLESRLRNRGSDSEEVIQRRLENAKRELTECRKFHDEAAENFIGIVRAERVRTVRVERIIARLLAEIGR